MVQAILKIETAPKNGDGFWLILDSGEHKPAHIRVTDGSISVDEDANTSEVDYEPYYYILCLTDDFEYDWETCTEGYDLDDSRVLGWIPR